MIFLHKIWSWIKRVWYVPVSMIMMEIGYILVSRNTVDEGKELHKVSREQHKKEKKEYHKKYAQEHCDELREYRKKTTKNFLFF